MGLLQMPQPVTLLAAPSPAARCSCHQQTCRHWWLQQTASDTASEQAHTLRAHHRQLPAAGLQQQQQTLLLLPRRQVRVGVSVMMLEHGLAAVGQLQGWRCRLQHTAWRRVLQSCSHAGTVKLLTVRANCLLGWQLGPACRMQQQGRHHHLRLTLVQL
jgi:hypothetical protein